VSGLFCVFCFLVAFVSAETKHYALVATEEIIYPDCTPRLSLVVNGTFPGPALYATAGDHIFIRYVAFERANNVRVYNSASSDNLTMHWHGISQYGSPFADGTPYASQWPIPAGKYFDYEFQFDDDVDGTL
jgi:FtsP/CotA-like multicopper oxidase with cupredoxin domain